MVEEKEVRMSNDLLFKEMLCHKDNRDILIHFIKGISMYGHKWCSVQFSRSVVSDSVTP